MNVVFKFIFGLRPIRVSHFVKSLLIADVKH